MVFESSETKQEKPLAILTDTIVGRSKEDFEKYGTKGMGYIGKHIVGTGEDAHLTTRVLIDLLKPHVLLCTGKRGSGKSYSAAVILEEFCLLPEEFRKNLSFVVIDPMGIYWSMKFPNESQSKLLKNWDLKLMGFKDFVKVFVPIKQKEEYEKAGVPVDGTVSISLKEFTAEDLIFAFGFKRTEELSITLEKNFNALFETDKNFGFDDLIERIREDREAKKEVRDALTSLLQVADQWGLVVKEGIRIEDLVNPGCVNIIDLSRMRSTELRSLLTALLARRIYSLRVLARKEEERAKIEGEEPKLRFPVTWLVLEEAHNFMPSDSKVASTESIQRLAREGREPGVGMIAISQMPDKLDRDFLSQTDIVISFRLTSEADINALSAVMQSYMREDLRKYLNSLPRISGTAIIIDDILEKVFTVNIRPRLSHHAAATAVVA
jgi:hypothetical protein